MKHKNSLTLLVTIALFTGFHSPTYGQKKRNPEQEAARDAKHAADDARRREIPVGGNFKPDPKVPAIVTITHGMRIVLSHDDGKTWKQVFMGAPAGDHGYWASTNIAYTNGVFAGFSGWGSAGHGSFIASEDGVNWRHLAGNYRKGRWDSYSMNDTLGAAGGKGAFVTVGTSFETTPDFGVSWHQFSPRKFEPAVKTHHMRAVYGDYEGGRFLVMGDGPKIFYSSDLGISWTLSPMKGWGEWTEGQRKGMAYGNGAFVIVDGEGTTARCSVDGGDNWTSHPTGAEGAARLFSSLSFVDGEFWITGEKSRASKDGITWRDLPESTPLGIVTATDKGTYINVYRKRETILRSTDGTTWKEVYALSPEDMKTGGGAQGFADIVFGLINAAPTKP